MIMPPEDYAIGWIGFFILFGGFGLGVFLLFVCLSCIFGIFSRGQEETPRRRSAEHDVDDMVLYDMVQDNSDHQVGAW